MDSAVSKKITLDTLRARRDEILALAARYGAYNVRVFGSVARNESALDSDVDLLVNFEDWVSLYELAGLKRSMEELLGCKVDIVEDHDGLRERFRKHILQDGVAL